ncbi:MAG TPA: hypothetical protein DCO68_04125 [Methylophilaceae bacterium]|nr:hypothetical protein [Methylophilaceae bacterium]HAJ71245.1 hypothetical protein [Methylophilaceae bacterium]
MKNASSNLLILTATITPPVGAIKLSRTDPKLRLDDYIQAFKFYLPFVIEGKISGLIFADNSASDISEIQKICQAYNINEKIEFISFEGLDYPPEYGRGYGEFKLIDYVMQHSKLIAQASPDAYIWKITGRYILKNLGEIVFTRPAKADIYCHCRNIPIPWLDLFVLSWKKKVYNKTLKNICEKIREDQINTSSEIAFRSILDNLDTQFSITKRFRKVPDLQGIRGSDSQGYQEMKLKLLVRKVLNILVPWLWI